MKIFIGGMIPLLAAWAGAQQFNYDTHQTYIPFGVHNPDYRCTETGPTMQALLRHVESSPEGVAIEAYERAIPLLSAYRGCVCDAYVALRLTRERFTSARSGGRSLNFQESLRNLDVARRLSAALAASSFGSQQDRD